MPPLFYTKKMEKKVQIVTLMALLLKLFNFIASHYYCLKYDYVTPGVSLYQSYYYPLMVNNDSLIGSFFIICVVFIFKSYRVTKIIAMSLFSIDLITSLIVLHGFNFNFYIELIYLIYGLVFSFLAIELFSKKIFAIMIPLLLFTSCFSTRDVEKNRISESSKTNLVDNSISKKNSSSKSSLDFNIKKFNELLAVNKDQSFTIREKIKPIDNTKPSSYNGNEFINAEIETEKTYNKNDNVSQEKKSEDLSLDKKYKVNETEDSKKDIKAESGNKKKGEAIQSHRNTVDLWWLVPIVIVAMLFLFFKNKAKILSVFNAKSDQ